MRTLAYRALFIARDPSFSDAHVQSAIDEVPPLLPNKFQEAEDALLDGKHPLQILRDFLNPRLRFSHANLRFLPVY